jgi:hypothetical protein
VSYRDREQMQRLRDMVQEVRMMVIENLPADIRDDAGTQSIMLHDDAYQRAMNAFGAANKEPVKPPAATDLVRRLRDGLDNAEAGLVFAIAAITRHVPCDCAGDFVCTPHRALKAVRERIADADEWLKRGGE